MPTPNLPIKTGHLFIGAAILMGVATMSIFSGGKREVAREAAKVETQEVVVPLVPINEGSVLSRSDITTVKWPSAYIPKGAVYSDPFQVVGRIAKQDLFPGEPIFNQKVSGGNNKGGLTPMIPQGRRAITIAVSEIKGVAGFIKPGDHVDVLTTFDVQKNDEHDELKKTKTVLQDVLVLASAQTMVADNHYDIETPEGVARGDAEPKKAENKKDGKKTDKTDKKEDPKAASQELEKMAKERAKEKKEAEKAARMVSSITVALTPEEAEKIALAEESGTLRLTLRPETDHTITSLSGIDSEKLEGKTSTAKFHPVQNFAPPPPMQIPPMGPPPSLGAQVEFIQGNDKTLYNFNP